MQNLHFSILTLFFCRFSSSITSTHPEDAHVFNIATVSVRISNSLKIRWKKQREETSQHENEEKKLINKKE